jgi:hypothetical protein
LTHGTIALIILAIHGTIALIIHPGKRGEIDVYSFQDASFLYVWFLISGAQGENERQFEREETQERRVEEYKNSAEIMTKWARSALFRKRYQVPVLLSGACQHLKRISHRQEEKTYDDFMAFVILIVGRG